jgi:hypothetical protein
VISLPANSATRNKIPVQVDQRRAAYLTATSTEQDRKNAIMDQESLTTRASAGHTIIVNRSGKIVADFQIEHTAQGWQHWREQVAALGPWGWLPAWRPARALSSSS